MSVFIFNRLDETGGKSGMRNDVIDDRGLRTIGVVAAEELLIRFFEMLLNIPSIDLTSTLEWVTGTLVGTERCEPLSETMLVPSTCDGESWERVVRSSIVNSEECLTFLAKLQIKRRE